MCGACVVQVCVAQVCGTSVWYKYVCGMWYKCVVQVRVWYVVHVWYVVQVCGYVCVVWKKNTIYFVVEFARVSQPQWEQQLRVADNQF